MFSPKYTAIFYISRSRLSIKEQKISLLCLISSTNHLLFDLYIKQTYLLWKWIITNKNWYQLSRNIWRIRLSAVNVTINPTEIWGSTSTSTQSSCPFVNRSEYQHRTLQDVSQQRLTETHTEENRTSKNRSNMIIQIQIQTPAGVGAAS